MANPAPFVCTLRVDRNRISDEQFKRLMRIFGQLKRKNVYPDVAFDLKMKPIPYAGKDAVKNKDWQITIGNVDEMDKEAMMHEIKNEKQLKLLGFNENQFQKTSNEYLYAHSVINTSLMEEFISSALKGQLPKYYRSEEPHPLAPIRQLVGSQFDETVLKDDHDHVVY